MYLLSTRCSPLQKTSRLSDAGNEAAWWKRAGAGALRYNEIRRAVDGISQRVLTLSLKELERDGLVHRMTYPEIRRAWSTSSRSRAEI